MRRAKRPYEGTKAYEAGRKDAFKDLYEELIETDKRLIDKDDIMKYLKLKIYLNDV